jgi:phosphate transporter
MKFSHTLSLNSNPDWENHYIDYAGLKKVIHEVQSEAQVLPTHDHDHEHDHAGDDDEEEDRKEHLRQTFLSKLTPMVSGVRLFYDRKKGELDIEMARLQPLLERSSSYFSLASLDAYETTPLNSNSNSSNSSSSKLKLKLKSATSLANNVHVNLEDQRREICDMFTQYHNLKQYADLNCTAVRKILKKYDKTLLDNLKETHYLESLKLMLPFWDGNTPELDRSIQTLQTYFAHFYCNDNQKEAQRQLQLMVREVITFQRHSVWLDVIQDQRKNEAVTIRDATLPKDGHAQHPLLLDNKSKSLLLQLPLSLSPNAMIGTGAFLLFFAIILWPLSIFDNDNDNDNDNFNDTQRNALAMFVLVSILWAAETLPLFVTSMLVPFLAVVLRVIQVDGVRLDAVSASRHVFGAMFSHVIMLLLGGFSIAAALSKHNIAQLMASCISRQCGSDIRTVLLVNMVIATASSMWISNVAAPVLCYSLLSPILKATTANTSRALFGTAQRIQAEQDYRLCRALVMGIALASNVGGMASPISSPQNLFAIEYTPIGWLAWFSVSIPLCIVLNLLLWLWLIVVFDLPRETDSAAVQYALQRDRQSSSMDPFTMKQYHVMAVSIGTVLLWCASVNLSSFTGQMGILGIVPFCLFFGSGLLTKEDLNSFLWSVVILAQGGLVLGEAVKTSGLLDVIAENIALFIEQRKLSLWATLCIFSCLILVCTTFVSHTVGAIVVIPIVEAVGSQMQPIPHAKELVFVSALACSAAMGLPVSGFPNMTAVSVEDRLGNRYLTTRDFIKYAIPASLISWAVIVTLGYWLVSLAVQIRT